MINRLLRILIYILLFAAIPIGGLLPVPDLGKVSGC